MNTLSQNPYPTSLFQDHLSEIGSTIDIQPYSKNLYLIYNEIYLFLEEKQEKSIITFTFINTTTYSRKELRYNVLHHIVTYDGFLDIKYPTPKSSSKEYQARYYQEHTKEKRQRIRESKTATCVVCGKTFTPSKSFRVVCCEECRKIRTLNNIKRYQEEHKEELYEKKKVWVANNQDKMKSYAKKYHSTEKFKKVVKRYLKSEKGKIAVKKSYENLMKKKQEEGKQ